MSIVKLLDGRSLAGRILAAVAARAGRLKREAGVAPGLGVLLAGDDPLAVATLMLKRRACERVGIFFLTTRLPGAPAQAGAIAALDRLNVDPRVHGILLQLPLPPYMDLSEVTRRLSPEKDIDCMHPLNLGTLVSGIPALPPCTPVAVQRLLEEHAYGPEGKRVAVCGTGRTLALPLANMLSQKREAANATVTVCPTLSPVALPLLREAEIIIADLGAPEALRGDMVREGAVVVDGGNHRMPDRASPGGYRLAGDVHFPSVAERAAAITPVPGGVGPVTVAVMLENTVIAAERALAGHRPGE